MKKSLTLSVILISGYSFASQAAFNPTDAAKFEKTNQCTSCDLSFYTALPKADRREAVLTYSDLTHFSNDLSSGKPLENWGNADLSNSILDSGTIQGDFSNAKFVKFSMFNYSSLIGVFNNANLTGIVIKDNSSINSTTADTTSGCSNLNLSNSIISKSNLYCNNLMNANFSSANIDNSTIGWSSAKLDGSNFTNAKITNTSFNSSFLDSAKFINTNLSNSNLSNTVDIMADFTGANLTGVDLSNANLCGAKITDIQLKQAANLSCAVKPDCSGIYPKQNGGSC